MSFVGLGGALELARRSDRRRVFRNGAFCRQARPSQPTVLARISLTSLGVCDGSNVPRRGSRSSGGHAGSGFGITGLERLAVLSMNDSGYVRRRVLSSVRGRRVGRQRHARSKTIPECRSGRRTRPQRGGSANKTRHAHHRDSSMSTSALCIALREVNSARISCDDTVLQCTGRNQPICRSRAMPSASRRSVLIGIAFSAAFT